MRILTNEDGKQPQVLLFREPITIVAGDVIRFILGERDAELIRLSGETIPLTIQIAYPMKVPE